MSENYKELETIDFASKDNEQPSINEGYNYLKVVHIQYPDLTAESMLIKRMFDVMFSIIVMTIGLPVFMLIYLITKLSSPGPVFFKQERIGLNEQPFYIYKFRSMYVDAEKFGPQLSSETDPRITKWGRVIRRTRLDELPQFYNVLRGEMSVVGPRPERQYFIDQIVAINPSYKILQILKPGITSMGQIYFGYAENVDEMCSRMIYDLEYLHNVNLNTDLNIICKTVKIMFEFKGK